MYVYMGFWDNSLKIKTVELLVVLMEKSRDGQSLGFILWEQWMSAWNWIAIQSSNSCWDISIWAELVDHPTAIVVLIWQHIPLCIKVHLVLWEETLWYQTIFGRILSQNMTRWAETLLWSTIPIRAFEVGTGYKKWIRQITWCLPH